MPVRTLASAALASGLFAADMVLLTLFLNPGFSAAAEALPLLTALFLPYAAATTLALVVLAAIASLLRWWERSLRPPLEGLPWFTTLAFATVATAAAIYWLNLSDYRDSISTESALALWRAASGLSGCALLLLGVGLAALVRPERRRAASAALVVLAAAGSVIVPLALRPGVAPRERPVPLATEPVKPLRRITLVGIDGLGPEFVREGAARGRLPGFAQLLRRGAQGPLRTLEPTEGPPLWTTIVTGRLPRDHGVKSFANYRLRGSASALELLPKGAFVSLLERAGLVSTQPVTSASRRRRALWNALNAFGIQTGVVRLWGTHPAERVQGFMLSNYFHLVARDPGRARDALHPPDLLEELRARAVRGNDLDERLVARLVDLQVAIPDGRFPWRHELVDRALAPDLAYETTGATLRAAYDPPFFATYFYGLDVVLHSFTRFARPEEFGSVSDPELRRYGQVVDRYAALLDEWLGALQRGSKRGEILLVVSAYGMRPVPFWRHLLSMLVGGSTMSASHTGAPPGFLLAAGDGVRAGALVEHASILDLAPTVLYLMGLPVARDMEGRVLSEMLEDSFARAHPVTFIPSYESLAVTPVAGPPDLDLPPLPDEER